MPHGLQCWRVRGACWPSLAKQLVIWVVVEGIHRHRNLLLQLDVHWNVPGWYECSTKNKPRKQVCARTSVSRTCMAHGLQCLCERGACCPSLPKQLVICRFFEVSPVPITVVVSTGCFTGLVRVVLKFPLNGNRAKVYAHVVAVRGHVRRTVCTVCATDVWILPSPVHVAESTHNELWVVVHNYVHHTVHTCSTYT